MTARATQRVGKADDWRSGPVPVDTSLIYEELRREYARLNRPIEVDFRALVHWLRIGDQLTHQIHPYPGKLLPHIAHFFANAAALAKPGAMVLDPFCGSGTVALEASLAGHTPYAADANPLARLITTVKTTPYNTDQLIAGCARIAARAARYRSASPVDVVNAELWYIPEHKRNLEKLLRSIDEEDSDCRDFFRVCFSALARRLSFADPAISVPVRQRTKPSLSSSANDQVRARIDWLRNANVIAEFRDLSRANVARVGEANAARQDRQAAVLVGSDARSLQRPGIDGVSLSSDLVPLVITSPPYGSAQKYIRASSLSLNWLGFAAPNALTDLEGRTIGREHLPLRTQQEAASARLSRRYAKLVAQVRRVNDLRAAITERYLLEMQSAVAEIVRVVAPGGHAVVVIGNNHVCGEVLRNDQFLIDCFVRLDMPPVLHLLDHIKSRGLMIKRNATASVISRESVIVFKKAH